MLIAGTITVNERIQIGDIWLLRFTCPVCRCSQLQGYPVETLDCCMVDASQYELNISYRRRTLVGSSRKRMISKRIIQRLFALQGEQCGYCQELFNNTPYHVEHIIPLCVGGTNSIDNLCLSCPSCNRIASTKVFATFAAKKQYILGKKNLQIEQYDIQ